MRKYSDIFCVILQEIFHFSAIHFITFTVLCLAMETDDTNEALPAPSSAPDSSQQIVSSTIPDPTNVTAPAPPPPVPVVPTAAAVAAVAEPSKPLVGMSLWSIGKIKEE